MKKIISLLSAAAIAAVSSFSCLSPVSQADAVSKDDTIKIMCIGDSITDGYGIAGSYRKFLYHGLTEKGYDVDMIGSKEGWNTTYTDPDTGESFEYDDGNTGYSGYAIKAYSGREGIYETLVSTNCLAQKPDIVILQIGTNNVIDNHDADETWDDLDTLISYISENIPDSSALFVTTIPELDPNREEVYSWFGNYRHSADWQTQYSDEEAAEKVDYAWKLYNANLQAGVYQIKNNAYHDGQNGPDINIGRIDEVITDVKTQLADGVHPNNTGYKLMGEYWTQVLDDYLQGRTASEETSTTTTSTTTAKTTTTTTAAHKDLSGTVYIDATSGFGGARGWYLTDAVHYEGDDLSDVPWDSVYQIIPSDMNLCSAVMRENGPEICPFDYGTSQLVFTFEGWKLTLTVNVFTMNTTTTTTATTTAKTTVTTTTTTTHKDLSGKVYIDATSGLGGARGWYLTDAVHYEGDDLSDVPWDSVYQIIPSDVNLCSAVMRENGPEICPFDYGTSQLVFTFEGWKLTLTVNVFTTNTTTTTNATTTAKTTVTTATTTEPAEDTSIRINDILGLSRYLLGYSIDFSADERTPLWDVDENGRLDSFDLILMRQILIDKGNLLREKFGDDYCLFDGGVDITIITEEDKQETKVTPGSSGSNNKSVAVNTKLYDLEYDEENDCYYYIDDDGNKIIINIPENTIS